MLPLLFPPPPPSAFYLAFFLEGLGGDRSPGLLVLIPPGCSPVNESLLEEGEFTDHLISYSQDSEEVSLKVFPDMTVTIRIKPGPGLVEPI